jgi:hypothetical protein
MNESLRKMSVVALKVEQKKKEEELKSLERKYNYKMKKIMDSSKHKYK